MAQAAFAERLIEAIHPFAVITPEVDQRLFARRGIVAFGSQSLPESTYRDAEGYIWNSYPSYENQAHLFASYVCQKVVPHPVALGDPAGGRERVLALLSGYGLSNGRFRSIAQAVRTEVEGCGGSFAQHIEFPFKDTCRNGDLLSPPIRQLSAVATLMDRGVTTIVWPGCIDSWLPLAALALGYHPEWIILGDSEFDTNIMPSDAMISRSLDGDAVIVTERPMRRSSTDEICLAAAQEIDPSITADPGVCFLFPLLRQFATAVQMAGPRLGVATMLQGRLALPRQPSADVRVPACFYSADATDCPRDAQVEIWRHGMHPADSTGIEDGCWVPIEGGRRYVAGAWPPGNIDAQLTIDGVCNGFAGPNYGFGYLPDWRELQPVILPR